MNKFELIDKFFSDTLSDKEVTIFNSLLQEDQEFKEEFLFQKNLKKALLLNQRETLKETLQGFEKDLKKESKIFTLRNWLIAATIIILLGIGAFFYMPYGSQEPAKIYAAYFEPYRNIIRPVERGEDDGSIESKAFQAYENGKYHKAINLFNSIEFFEDDNSDYIDFYKGISYLAINKNEEAIDVLLPIATEIEKGDYDISQKANWYLALAYLNSNEIDKAKSQFYMIAQDNAFTYKKEEAGEILKKLE
jgi:hypothetical protein